ncbi:winged helix-turn-helix domain-containing protein [Kangiella sediminilitoris]|uniref:Two component transcriptional regulator, winged helix family n=1 Tax=Kangiella sediminilitoris TaxID=1144748 RepID=A0A1B3BB90_9GAMM|nr:winged helix-turn-helix domain-containing protein [Kangiella sediminilitoris]AOE50062.1 Two component transcriptional regulator, winged helix family [Kangiella sediminilitoris]
MNDTILLVEDDEKLSSLIADFLRSHDFNVSVESHGSKAIDFITQNQPRAVILDVMLPGADGFTICRTVRPKYQGPILMLTSLSDEIDEIAGLENGADDYLSKPVKSHVLLAHLRALLRRIETDEPSQQQDKVINAGSIAINPQNRSVLCDGEEVHLTTAEYNLLWLLAERSGEVMSREELHRKTFKLEYDGTDRSIDLRISRLRRKLGDDPKLPYIIKTIRGEGYLLAV